MVTPHLTNTEFELLMEGKVDQLSQTAKIHVEHCSQCKQELAELSSVFHWPTSTKASLASEPLAERVMSELAQRKRSGQAFYVTAGVGLLCVGIAVISLMPLLWQYLPEQAKAATLGVFPVMEWMPLFQKLFSTEWWPASSALSLLFGGLLTLSLVMLIDSVLVGRLMKKMKSKKQTKLIPHKQTSQGNRT